MKNTLSIATVALALAACVPLGIYHREGDSVARMESDLTNCEVVALEKVPVNTQIRTRPAIFHPGYRHCDAEGNCKTRLPYWESGQTYTFDANRDLRGRVVAQCMSQKGYQYVELPPCPGSVARSVPTGATRILPRLTPQSCVIRNPSGSWQIVNPAG